MHPSTGVKSVKELIALAKAKQDELSIVPPARAPAPHLAAELFDVRAGVKMIHVPYQGSPQAVTDLIAGRIQVLFSPASTVLPMSRRQDRRARLDRRKRTGAAPDLPTMAEAGIADSRPASGSG